MNEIKSKNGLITTVYVVREQHCDPDENKRGRYVCAEDIIDILTNKQDAIDRLRSYAGSIDEIYICSRNYNREWDKDRTSVMFTGPMNSAGNRHQIYVYVTEGKLIEEIEEN